MRHSTGAADKAIAITAICGMLAAAVILIAWPEHILSPAAPEVEVDRVAAPIASRVIPVDLVGLPRLPRATARSATAPLAARVLSVPPQQSPPNLAVQPIGEPPLLASRSSAFASDLPRISIVPVDWEEPTRPAGALTRAMGTTAAAFKTAGSSVAGAFKKVF